jgi:hypothetical protein
MSHLVICAVPEPGHILPTVRVAKLLQARGHVVSYIIVPRYESFFRSHQIPCRVIFSDILPMRYPEDLFMDIGESSIRRLTTHYFNGNGDELLDELILRLRDLDWNPHFLGAISLQVALSCTVRSGRNMCDRCSTKICRRVTPRWN